MQATSAAEFLICWVHIMRLLDLPNDSSARILEYGSGSGQLLLLLREWGLMFSARSEQRWDTPEGKHRWTNRTTARFPNPLSSGVNITVCFSNFSSCQKNRSSLTESKVAFWEFGILDNFGRFVFRREELRWITR